MDMCLDRRGEQINLSNLDKDRIMLTYRLPLSEVIIDFFDKLKALSSGYATFDYEEMGYELVDLVKVN